MLAIQMRRGLPRLLEYVPDQGGYIEVDAGRWAEIVQEEFADADTIVPIRSATIEEIETARKAPRVLAETITTELS